MQKLLLAKLEQQLGQTVDLARLSVPTVDCPLLELSCVLARVNPVMPRLDFASEVDALATLAKHCEYHGSVRLVLTARTDRAVSLLLSVAAKAKQGSVVCPFATMA